MFGRRPLGCNVSGFERLTHHYEVGHGLVEESGKMKDDAPISQVRIRVIVHTQDFGNVSCYRSSENKLEIPGWLS